mgnify:CR=1 FL=1
MKYTDIEPYLNNYAAVPIVIDQPCRDFDPEPIVAALRAGGHTAFMLHGAPDDGVSRYTYIVDRPRTRYELNGHTLTTISGTTQHQMHVTNPGATFTKILTATRTPVLPELPPFVGGLAGYFAYEYAQTVHPQLHLTPAPDGGLPDALLLVADCVIIHDAVTNQLFLSQITPTMGLTQADFAEIQVALQARLQTITDIMQQGMPAGAFGLDTTLTPDYTPEAFAARVAKVQAHIHDGDIFQLILANPQRAQMHGDLLNAAKTVLRDNPTPYQFYLGSGTREVLGASPELLVARHDEELQTFPLAGTRRRGQTPEEDAQLASELTHSEKECSEHNMLIDLGRNDLGAVSQLGSVQVTSVRQLLYFASVMHMGSTVTSRIAPGITPLDVVAALLPAGTLAGAPKLSAMTIISQLEGTRRGVYGGTIGYLGYDGNLELAIGIRLAQREGDQISLHAGAGIVTDSVAKHEYQEFNNKIRGVKNALLRASEELA